MSRARYAFVALLVACAMTFLTDGATADTTLPLRLQAQLVSKLSAFDRNFAHRAGSMAHVLVLQKAGDAESSRVALNVAKVLKELQDVGGIAAQVDIDSFPGPTPLAERCRSQKIALIYLSTGFDGEMGATAAALAGVDVMTIGATASLAERGAVVGFDLEEGRPKIVVNLKRAKAQNVDFKAELLKFARIVN